MSRDTDSEFYDRADSHIALANEQAQETELGKVSASLMYATARYNCFISACEAASAECLAAGKEKIIDYFVEQFRKMLAENLDDWIVNFDEYLGGPENGE